MDYQKKTVLLRPTQFSASLRIDAAQRRLACARRKTGMINPAVFLLLVISKTPDIIDIIPPVFLDLHPRLHIDLGPHEPLNILPGVGLLRNLDKEVPHGTAIEVTKFSERDSGVIDLDVTI